MRANLPVASYLFILRKHLVLVLGTMAVVLGGGFLFAATREPVYRSVAIVQIQARAPGKGEDRGPSAGVDQVFISDQVYLLRSDVHLARRVLEHLREEPKEGGAPSAAGDEGSGSSPGPVAPIRPAGPEEPPRPDPALFRALRPEQLLGRVSVANIPPTSFYEFAVIGPDPVENHALANAYARVFSDVFREEAESRYLASMNEYIRRREIRRRELEAADRAISDFKQAHSGIDLEGVATGAARERVEAMRKVLAEERSRLQVLKREQRDVEDTLAAVGLRIRRDADGGPVLEPADPGAAAPEGPHPLLSERVQALDVVAANASVRKAMAGIEGADAQYRALRTGPSKIKEDAPEVQEALRQRASFEAVLKRGTEAALLKLAQDVARTEGVVSDWTKQGEALEAAAAEESVARAELERLRKISDGIRTDVDALAGLILETERQRKEKDGEGGSVRVKSYAKASHSKLVAPNKPVIYGGTVALAVLLAAALAYLLEYLDDTVKTREDFDRLVRLPFLGYVPHLKESEIGHRDLVVARGKTGSPEVESFRAIRTAIQFSRPDRRVQVILVTSAGPGEGKTTVSINVASAFTGGKGRVLLIDADLRRARVHSALGVENVVGMTNVLVGDATLAEAIRPSVVPGLDVLSAGPIPPNPAELLGSVRMRELLAAAAAGYDRVIVDSPPIVAVTDPALLANYVDAVFLVVSIGKTSVRTLQRAQESLATVGATIHGAILNNADVRTSGYAGTYGGYGYGYGYGGGGGGEKPVATLPG